MKMSNQFFLDDPVYLCPHTVDGKNKDDDEFAYKFHVDFPDCYSDILLGLLNETILGKDIERKWF